MRRASLTPADHVFTARAVADPVVVAPKEENDKEVPSRFHTSSGENAEVPAQEHVSLTVKVPSARLTLHFTKLCTNLKNVRKKIFLVTSEAFLKI